MKKNFLIGLTSAAVSGVILNLVLPSILLVASTLVISVGTGLDPRYGGDQLEDAWISVVIVIGSLAVYAFAGSLVVGGFVVLIAKKIESLWNYLISILTSLVVHYHLLAILLITLSSIPGENAAAELGRISILATAVTAPLIGAVCCFFVKRGSKKNNR